MPVLHGFAAADFARREMEIEDEEILMAIKSHTCGRQNMTDLEKVVYLADMLSEERNYPEKEKIAFPLYIKSGYIRRSAVEHPEKSPFNLGLQINGFEYR